MTTTTRTATQIAYLLNEYEEAHSDDPQANLWGDVIWELDEYDGEATDEADPSYTSTVVVLTDGSRVEWAAEIREWVAR